jgi:hypothetical protein
VPSCTSRKPARRLSSRAGAACTLVGSPGTPPDDIVRLELFMI